MISEAQFQATVTEAFGVSGWWVFHHPDSRRTTPGYPDLTLIHPDGRLVYAELKTATGKVRPEQRAVIDALRRGGHQAFIWRPDDWPAVQAVISGQGVVSGVAG